MPSTGGVSLDVSEHMTTHTTVRLKRGVPTRAGPGFSFTGKIPGIGRAGRRTRQFQFHSPYKAAGLYRAVHRFGTPMTEATVRIEEKDDRWRFVCPRGHRTWEPTNHHFWCQQCARADECDGVFHQLRDKKTGREYERDEVQLLTVSGPYDRDVDGGTA
jgi:hypothetical protein